MSVSSCKFVILSFSMLASTGAFAQTTLAAPAASVPPSAPVATPIGNPADWFPASAYPDEAKAAGIQGRTEFQLQLDAKGRVTECDIAASSGSALLDSTTCALLVSNGRFKPAHDANGRDVPGIWHSAMVWRLAAAAPDILEGFSGQTAKSPAEVYNESVSAEQKAAQAAQDQQQGDDSN